MKKYCAFFLMVCVVSFFSIKLSIASTVNLNANFRLFGEVQRFGIGYGDMEIHFGLNVPEGDIAPSVGSIGFAPGGIPFSAGVLSSVNLSSAGFTVVDTEFSVPFSLEVGTPASMYIGLGDNGINGIKGGSIQVVFDFSDNISYAGSLLGGAFDQGLSLVSVTKADGGSLSDAGLSFDFISKNILLTAFASSFDATGSFTVTSTETPDQNRAAVFVFPGTATSKLRGGYNRSGVVTDYLVNLDVSPETDPFVFDVAGATISGHDNVVLTGNDQHPVPVPTTIMLLGSSLLGLAAIGRHKSGSVRRYEEKTI